MKKNKIMGSLLAVLVIILVLVLGVKFYYSGFTSSEETTFKQNKNQSFLKSQEIDGLKFDKINCTYDGKISKISYEIKNVSNHEITFFGYNLKVLDKEKKVLSNVNLRIERTLAAGEITTVTNEIPDDVSNAYSMNFEIVWEKEAQNEAK